MAEKSIDAMRHELAEKIEFNDGGWFSDELHTALEKWLIENAWDVYYHAVRPEIPALVEVQSPCLDATTAEIFDNDHMEALVRAAHAALCKAADAAGGEDRYTGVNIPLSQQGPNQSRTIISYDAGAGPAVAADAAEGE